MIIAKVSPDGFKSWWVVAAGTDLADVQERTKPHVGWGMGVTLEEKDYSQNAEFKDFATRLRWELSDMGLENCSEAQAVIYFENLCDIREAAQQESERRRDELEYDGADEAADAKYQAMVEDSVDA